SFAAPRLIRSKSKPRASPVAMFCRRSAAKEAKHSLAASPRYAFCVPSPLASIRLMYFLAAIAILQGILTLLDGIRAARHMRTYRPKRASRERVVVFCPCKGTDSEFEKNIHSILDQDYPSYEVRFIVESEDDPAYK